MSVDLDELAESRLDDAIDDARWDELVATHGEPLRRALAQARALRAAVASLPRAALPETARAGLGARDDGAVATSPTPTRSRTPGADARVVSGPGATADARRSRRTAMRVLVPVALAAGVIAAVTLVPRGSEARAQRPELRELAKVDETATRSADHADRQSKAAKVLAAGDGVRDERSRSASREDVAMERPQPHTVELPQGARRSAAAAAAPSPMLAGAAASDANAMDVAVDVAERDADASKVASGAPSIQLKSRANVDDSSASSAGSASALAASVARRDGPALADQMPYRSMTPAQPADAPAQPTASTPPVVFGLIAGQVPPTAPSTVAPSTEPPIVASRSSSGEAELDDLLARAQAYRAKPSAAIGRAPAPFTVELDWAADAARVDAFAKDQAAAPAALTVHVRNQTVGQLDLPAGAIELQAIDDGGAVLWQQALQAGGATTVPAAGEVTWRVDLARGAAIPAAATQLRARSGDHLWAPLPLRGVTSPSAEPTRSR